MFALSLIPLAALAGGAIDMVNAGSARNTMQYVCDGAALAAAKSGSQNPSGYAAEAQKYIAANAPAAYKNVTPNVTASAVGGASVTISLSVNVPTTTLGLVNIANLPVSVSCTVKGVKLDPMEVAFVLDYSSSMTDTVGGGVKWEAMRDAALALVNEIKINSDPGAISVGIVPFSKHVRVTLPGEYLQGNDTGSVTTCVLDRGYPNNLTDATPSGGATDPSKWVRSDDADCSTAAANDLELLPLTTDMDIAITKFNAMRTASGTNIQMGLAMGLHVLSPNLPFDEGTTYNDADKPKIMVLLSDGEQTVEGNGPNNERTVTHAKSNIEALCTQAKAEGITMVTIAFAASSQSTRDWLRNCASKPDLYFEPYNGQQLFAAFNGIGKVLGLGNYLSH